jgi:hypothetical protein
MSDQSKYQATFSGQFVGSQVAVGENNTLQQGAGVRTGEPLTAQEMTALMGQLADLRAQVVTHIPAEQRAQALRQIGDLEAETVAPEPPEPGRLARVYRWFLDNAPDLAESVSTLLLGPLVGKLVGGGAGAMAAALGADAKQSG